jgi:CRISPR system Cascade subunit CasA
VTAQFNLLDEPWLPVIMGDGARMEIGIRAALLSAAEIRELRDESPVVTAALHRLLLAILHRVLDGPRTLEDWDRLWDRGLDPDALKRYFNAWTGRFDLFDAKHPFFQVVGIPAEVKRSGIRRLAAELTNGGEGSAHFNHDADRPSLNVAFAFAARWLVGQQAAALSGTMGGGRGNFLDAPMARGAVFLIEGENLLRTLLLNLIPYDNSRPIPRTGEDLPAWERPHGAVRPLADNKKPARRAPTGYVDYLTWQSRAVRLDRPAAGEATIRECTVFDGETLDPPKQDIDPMMAYSRDPENKKQPVSVFRVRSDRALWRDLDALLALKFLATVASRGVIPASARMRLSTMGWASSQAKVDLWRQERLSLPIAYLSDRDLVSDLTTALSLGTAAAAALQLAARTSARFALSPGSPKKADKDRVSQLADSLAPERLYWSRLEAPFRALLIDMPGDPSHRLGALRSWFEETLCRFAIEAFRRTVGTLDASARAHHAAVEGEAALFRGLYLLKLKSEFRHLFPIPQLTPKEAVRAAE